MKSIKRIFPFIASTGLALLAGSTLAAKTTLYHESFSDGSVASPSALNGSTPNTTIGSNTWSTADGNVGIWEANGSTGIIDASTGSSAHDNSAFLEFTPRAGNIYTLSATMTPPSGSLSSNGWAAIGFAQNNNQNQFWSNHPAPWFLWRDFQDSGAQAGEFVSWLGVGVNGDASEDTITASPTTFSVVLSTVDTAWTAEWFIGETSVRKETYATNPTINYVGFGRDAGASTHIDDFRLTVIPEPSSTGR